MRGECLVAATKDRRFW